MLILELLSQLQHNYCHNEEDHITAHITKVGKMFLENILLVYKFLIILALYRDFLRRVLASAECVHLLIVNKL